jgi:kynurenine formamidase
VASLEAHAKGIGSPAHLVLLSNGVPIIEGLTNMGELRKKRFKAACLPLKMRGLSGACVRVIAIEE